MPCRHLYRAGHKNNGRSREKVLEAKKRYTTICIWALLLLLCSSRRATTAMIQTTRAPPEDAKNNSSSSSSIIPTNIIINITQAHLLLLLLFPQKGRMVHAAPTDPFPLSLAYYHNLLLSGTSTSSGPVLSAALRHCWYSARCVPHTRWSLFPSLGEAFIYFFNLYYVYFLETEK